MHRYPLRVEARRDEPLSRWLWLVKWLLLIPHYVVLLFLYVGLVALTLVAYLSVLVTGRYPAAVAAYATGVLRWSWRVAHYGYQVLGTDRYPPFTLADDPDHPARLLLDEPPRPPRWLPLVAWLFAVPHLLVLGALAGAVTWRADDATGAVSTAPLSPITVAVLIAGAALLFTGRYPAGLYDLLVGIARWGLRVVAYLLLLTPRYPPLRLDQGGPEPDGPPPSPPARPPVADRRGVAGPVVALIAGVLLLAPGAGLAAGGGVVLALDGARDPSGYVSSPALAVRTPTAAVTAEGTTLQAGDLFTRGFSDVGGVRVTVTGDGATPLFVGVARQSDVDSWLAATAHDQVTDVTSGTARYERAAGPAGPVAAPVAQRFWLASGTGTGAAALTWRATSGDFAVVVANADGSPGVAADVRAATQVPDLTGPGAGLLAGGIALLLVAVALVVAGGVGLGRRHTPPPPAPPPAAPPPGPAAPPPAAPPPGPGAPVPGPPAAPQRAGPR